MVEDQIKNSYSQSIYFDEPKVKDRVGRSLLATLPAALASLSSGYCWGYSSSALEDLQNAGTSSAFRLTVEQGSWFSSMICFGMMIGFPFIGWAINKFGRKGTMMLCAIPFVLGWLLISYARNVAMLYAGRSITGVACGAASFTSSVSGRKIAKRSLFQMSRIKWLGIFVKGVYVGEIAAARVRGALCNLKCLGFSLGVLLSLAVGVLCHWRWLAFIGTIPPTLVLILMIPMPQSPHWLLGKNRTCEALEAFLWLRGPNADVDEECSTIKKALGENVQYTPSGRLSFEGREKLGRVFLRTFTLLISEMFPVRARGLPCSFVFMVFAVTQFFETTTYHSMTTVLTIQGAYWVYAGCCILGFLFVYFLLPETKGKTLVEIEDIFNRSVKHAYERIE
ncbi:solute carrier family 2, facilitated glucose transporter member 8-like [Stylophora pistillata]|uniref:solute carrier family 2, facilitated glucose transporter member 8-like n=1 Tax=Stylophora pistillata TaxID=50429 RepID=UPI000C04D445|nr:solute carrier family 2, facilitated glucose transporter member 8-like [Stylophora pistillata]